MQDYKYSVCSVSNVCVSFSDGKAINIREIQLKLAFTANGRSDHVTMISPHLLFTVFCFSVKVTSFVLAINTRISLHYSRLLISYFEEYKPMDC